MTRHNDDSDKTREELLSELAAARAEKDELQRELDTLHEAAREQQSGDDDEARAETSAQPVPFRGKGGALAQGSSGSSGARRSADRDQLLQDYLTIYNSLFEGLLSITSEGKLNMSNPSARTMLGWKRFELIGQIVHDRIHPRRADGDECRVGNCPILTALDSEVTLSGDDVYFHKGGSSFPVSYTITPWRVHEAHVGAVIAFHDISQRAQAQAKLEALQASYRATFEQLAVGIAHVNLDGTLRRANARLAEMLGYATFEMVGIATLELAHPEDYLVAMDRVRRLLASEGVSYAYETRMITKDRRALWTNVTGSLVRTAAGEPDYVLAVIERIDQRKALELELRRSEREATQRAGETQATLDAIPHPVLVFDAQGHILRGNTTSRRYLRELGIAPDGVFSWDSHPAQFGISAVDGRLLTTQELPLRRVLEGEILTSESAVEIKLRNRAGDEIYMSVTGAPARNDAGEIIEAVCVFRDITGQWRLEHELAAQVSQLEATFEAITDGVVVMDAEGNLLQANAAYRNLFASVNPGAEPPRALAPHAEQLALRDGLHRVVPLADLPSMRTLIGEVVRGRDAVELLAISHDGVETPLLVTGAPVRDERGMILGAVCVYRDVSERRGDLRQTRDMLYELLEIALSVALSAGRDQRAARARLRGQVSHLAARLADLAREKLGCQHAGIIAVDPITASMRPVATSGMTAEYEREWRGDAARSSLADYFDAGARSRLRQGEVVSHDLRDETPQSESGWAQRRILAAPVLLRGELIGFLGCEQVETMRDYTESELALVRAVAEVTALVLQLETATPRPGATSA